MWSVGCIFAEMLYKKHLVFRGDEDFDILVEIAKVLGTDGLDEYLEKYQIKPIYSGKNKMKNYKRRGFDDLLTKKNKKLVTEEALDLLFKMLRYDHAERITPLDALQHSYFDEVRGIDVSC